MIPDSLDRTANASSDEGAKSFINICPVCDSTRWDLLTPVWKNYHIEKEFYISPTEWFAECEGCGAIVILPLVDHKDHKKYGEVYYNQGVSATRTVSDHAISHFENFQKNNYDSIHTFLQKRVPSNTHPKWLDVGSVGYATTFDDYDFTTIEPDARVVETGRSLFHSTKIFSATLESHETTELFDGILFANSLYCVSTPLRTLRRANSLSKSHGRLLVAISTYFNDATSDREDGQISRIEDVIFGETLLVYYNQYTLEYLCSKAGFRLVSATEIPAYGYKTMQAYLFEKCSEFEPNPKLLELSKTHQKKKWEDCFENYINVTAATVKQINDKRTILVGSLQVLSDLTKYGSLNATLGFLSYPDNHVNGCTAFGIRFLDVEQIQRASKKIPNLRVVVCSFKNQPDITGFIRTILPNAEIFVPTRKSGMEFIDFIFRRQVQPSKAFVLKKEG